MSYALAVAEFSNRPRESYQIMPQRRILYVGNDLNLLQLLKGTLEDCHVVRCPGGSNARLLIESEINYSLLIFDDKLLNETGAELERFTRSQAHRKQTPIIIKKSDDFDSLIETIKERYIIR